MLTQAHKKAFLSIQTVADELNLNPETVRRAVLRGEIPSVRKYLAQRFLPPTPARIGSSGFSPAGNR